MLLGGIGALLVAVEMSPEREAIRSLIDEISSKLGPLGRHRFLEYKGSINVKTLMLITLQGEM